MNKKEIEKFKQILEGLRDQLTHAVKETNEDVKVGDDHRGHSQHQADEGTDDFFRNVSIEVSGKEVEILRQIERALEKIEEGTYGVCDVSGDAIPKKRLEAVPYATMTVEAQDKFEKGLIT